MYPEHCWINICYKNHTKYSSARKCTTAVNTTLNKFSPLESNDYVLFCADLYMVRQVFENKITSVDKPLPGIEFFFHFNVQTDDRIHNGWPHSLKPSLGTITGSARCWNRLQSTVRWAFVMLAIAYTTTAWDSQQRCMDPYWNHSQPSSIRNNP